MAPPRFDVFLSHSSQDKWIVERIAERLRRSGLEPWLDKWQLVPGVDWQRGLEEGLASSRTCAVFLGSDELGAWEDQEVRAALDRAVSDPDFRLFLVLLPGIPDPFDGTRVSPFLRLRTWVDYREGLDDEDAFRSLVSAIEGLAPGPVVRIESGADVCPYRGLEAFDEEHAEFFFGRRADVQRLLERLKATRFLAVLGASGSGKSSLVRAGLVPAVKEAPPGDTEVAILRPGAHPLEALAAALLRLGAGGGMQPTLDALVGDPRSLHLAASLLLAERPRAALLLVIDQFEEVFTLCRDEAERTALFSNLVYAATFPAGRVVVVPTMRADFYHRCGGYPELAQLLAAGQYLVSPLQREGLREAVEEPARRVGLAFEPGLVATIVDDVAGEPGGLPLLEHALLQLWHRRAGGLLTLAAYRASGGVHEAIAKQAEAIFAGLDATQREIARRLFLRLTAPGEGTEDTRRRALVSELEGGDVASVLASLVAARLVTVSRDEAGGQVVDVAHEALIRGWPRLRGWVDEDRSGLRVHRRLTEAAGEWDRLGRDESVLYRGARLAEAREWRAANAGAPNRLENEFVVASVAAEKSELERAQQRTRRLRTLAASLAALALLAIGAAGYAKHQTDAANAEKQIARSRALAATASAQLAVDPERGLLLAIEAMRTRPTEESRLVLDQAMRSSYLRAVIAPAGRFGIFSGAVVSPTGRWLALSESRSSELVDLRQPRQRHRVPGWDPVFRPKGDLFLTLTRHGVSVRSADTLKEVALLPSSGARSAAFDPTGRLVAVAGERGVVSIWGLEPPRRRWTLRAARGCGEQSRCEVDVSFVAGGTRLLVESLDVSGDRFLRRTETSSALWDTGSGTRIAHWPARSVPSPDGAVVMTLPPVAFVVPGSTPKGRAALWRSRDGSLLRRLTVADASFAPHRLLLTPTGKTVRVERVASGRTVAVLHAGRQVDDAEMSSDARLVAVGDRQGRVDVWNVSTRRRVSLGGEPVGLPTFSPDGHLLVGESGNGSTVRVWSAEDGATLTALRGFTAEPIGVGFAPDGSRFVTVSGDARVWAAPTDLVFDQGDLVVAAALSSRGDRVVTVGYENEARLWDARTGALVSRLDLAADATFSPDGRKLVTVGGDSGPSTAIVWRASDGARLHTLEHPDLVEKAEFSRGGLLVTSSDDGTVRIWDVAKSQRLVAIPTSSSQPPNAVHFSPDGRRLVTTSSDGTARVWSVSTGRPVAVMRGHSSDVWGASFSPDGRRLATAGEDGTVRIWDSATGKQLAARSVGAAVRLATFSPDGRVIATTGADDAALIWDPESRNVVELRGHAGEIDDVRFSSDGAFLLTAGEDGTARVWDTATGEAVDVLGGRSELLTDAEFSTDGKRILIASYDRTAGLVACPGCRSADGALALAESVTARKLTEAERAAYVRR